MTISEIYEKYNIMPNLQMHQLRVAAAASQIADSLSKTIDKELVVVTALLHDMGNIIKSDFSTNLFSLTEEEKTYWEKVKKEFIEKYGNDTHIATSRIAKELNMSTKTINLMEHNDFTDICDIAQDDSLERKILKYADLRVGPHGVISLNARFEDIIKRYAGLLRSDRKECVESIEKEIFSHSSIKPEDITDESVAPRIEKLKEATIY